MAYIRPLVLVFQEYASQSVSTPTTSLNPCVIGPCYHLIDSEDDALLASAGSFVVGGVTGVEIPSNAPGAVIEETSVTLTLKNVRLEVYPTAKAAVSFTDNVLTFLEANFPADALVGDYVAVDDDGAAVGTDLRVLSLDAVNFKVMVNKAVGQGAPSALQYDVTFSRGDVNVEVLNDDAALSVDTTLGTFDLGPYTVSGKLVYSADIFVSYKALRQDLSDVGTVSNLDEAKGALGKLVAANPLGYAVSITLANTTTPVKFIGVDTDDTIGYTAAKDRLEIAEDIYSVVPLTQSAAILAIFKSSAVQTSLPEIGKWRVAIGSTPLLTTKVLSEGAGAAENDQVAALKVFRDSDASFLSNSVDAGHKLVITRGGINYEYMVASVVSEDLLTTTTAMDALLATGGPDTYQVLKDLDKTQQATEIAAASASFGSSRFVHVWPDVCAIDGVDQPGYYLACAVAGMAAGLPSHQGFTRISIAGISGLKHSNDYFNQTQMDAIADGGTFIFQQANPSSAPYVRHQLTTDMSTLEFREFSFVKNFDYVSYIMLDVMDQFLGKYNITSSTLSILESAASGTLESLRLYNLPKIGSPVLDYSIDSVAQLDSLRDRVEMYIGVDFPYVLNTIGLHLVSR